MKNCVLTLVLVAGVLMPLIAMAQGTLCVSNIERAPTGSATIGSDYWIAQSFLILTSDPNTYTLDSVQLLMNPASGSPNGFTVSIFSAPFNSGGPQTNLGSLVGDTDPSSPGIYTYTASGITLSSGVEYFAVATAATPIAQGSYKWSATSSITRSNAWIINDLYFDSSDGSSWTEHGREEVFQMAIYTTVVPEPTTGALVGLGFAALGFWRWRRSES